MVILERRKRVASLYQRGLTQWEIARQEGVVQGTISRDLEHIRKEWLASMTGDMAAKKAEEFAKIDRIELWATEGWERSCRDAEATHTKTETAPGDGDEAEGSPVAIKTIKTINERTVKGQAGDPRFLERLSWCVQERARLLSMYPAKDVNLGGSVVVTVVGGVDLAAIVGAKPGLPYEAGHRNGSTNGNGIATH